MRRLIFFLHHQMINNESVLQLGNFCERGERARYAGNDTWEYPIAFKGDGGPERQRRSYAASKISIHVLKFKALTFLILVLSDIYLLCLWFAYRYPYWHPFALSSPNPSCQTTASFAWWWWEQHNLENADELRLPATLYYGRKTLSRWSSKQKVTRLDIPFNPFVVMCVCLRAWWLKFMISYVELH